MPWNWNRDFNLDEWAIPFNPGPHRKQPTLTVQDIERLAQEDEVIRENWKEFLMLLRLRLKNGSRELQAVDTLLCKKDGG